MHLDRYRYLTNNSFLDYEFISEGPKGKIKKLVRFTEIGDNIYNLGFGDLNEETGEINDIVASNNSDSRKILATVAATVHDFTIHYSNAWVVAKGSTLSRTRLYRMGIGNHYNELNEEFEIFGLKDTKWESFQLKKDYEAFLVRRR